jgi:uncharacterized protein YndB with AHSA1/START domain
VCSRAATETERGPELAFADGLVLRLERVLAAPREVVFAALTEPEELARWWGPRGFTTPSVELDLREGGAYRIAMQPPKGDLFHLVGELTGLEPPARLAYTFRWEPPAADDRETLVELVLAGAAGRTLLELTQGAFATQERLALHERGWTESLDRLERLLGE